MTDPTPISAGRIYSPLAKFCERKGISLAMGRKEIRNSRLRCTKIGALVQISDLQEADYDALLASETAEREAKKSPRAA